MSHMYAWEVCMTWHVWRHEMSSASLVSHGSLNESWLIEWVMTHWMSHDSLNEWWWLILIQWVMYISHIMMVTSDTHMFEDMKWVMSHMYEWEIWMTWHVSRHEMCEDILVIEWVMTHWMSHDSLNESWLIEWVCDMTCIKTWDVWRHEMSIASLVNVTCEWGSLLSVNRLS